MIRRAFIPGAVPVRPLICPCCLGYLTLNPGMGHGCKAKQSAQC